MAHHQSQLPASALHDAAKTNPDTKFSPFSFTLSNDANLTGIFYIPPVSTASRASSTPLLVGIHGGTCSAYTWDVSPTYTASNASDVSGLPFVAFNRPNYLDSSGWIIDRASSTSDTTQAPQFDPPADDVGYFAEEARWFHEYIFPALWTHFAVPNGYSAMVTNSHSMSVPSTIIAAGLYGSQLSTNGNKPQSYTWAGMIITGVGLESTQIRTQRSAALATNDPPAASDLPPGQDASIHVPPFKPSDKQDLMLGPLGLCDPALRPLISQQTTPFPKAEILTLVTMWSATAAEWQAAVRIPVLYGLGSHDWIWKAEKRTVDAFLRGFTASERTEGAVVLGGGHALELSPVSAGWWMRCCGWAVEVANGLEVGKKGIPVYE